jgi:hypothetical protein
MLTKFCEIIGLNLHEHLFMQVLNEYEACVWLDHTACSDWQQGPPSLMFNGYQVLSLVPEISSWVTKPTNNLHLVLRLRVSGAIPLFPPYAIMACTGTLPSTILYP